MSMATSESLRETQKQLVPDLDMAAAAQQLMMLSDEDSNSCSSSSNVKKISLDDQEEIDQRSRHETTWKMIEEIFGTEEEVCCRPKKRKYRSIVNIYRTTKPIYSGTVEADHHDSVCVLLKKQVE